VARREGRGLVRSTEKEGMAPGPTRRRTALLLVLAVGLPLAAAAFALAAALGALAREAAIAVLDARADELAGRLEAFSTDYQKTVVRLAASPDVVEYCLALPKPPAPLDEAMTARLEAFAAADASVRGVGIWDPAGKIFACSEKPLVGHSYGFRAYFQQALYGRPAISEIYVGSPEIGSVPSIAYVAPVKTGDGAVIGVASIWVKAASLWEVLRAANGAAGEGSAAVLYDRYGVRVAEGADSRALFHPAGPLDPATIDALVLERRFGENTRDLLESPIPSPAEFERASAPSAGREVLRAGGRLAAVRRLAIVPWTLFYLLPESGVARPLGRLAETRAARAGAAGLLVAILLAALLGRRVAGAARGLAAANEALRAEARGLADRAEALERRRARDVAFGRAAAALAGSGAPGELLERALAEAAAASGAALLVCYRLDPAARALAPVGAFAAAGPGRTATIAADGLAAEALRRGDLLVLDPLPAELDLRFEAAIAGGRPRAAALVPLAAGPRPVGLLVAGALASFTEEGLAALRDLAPPLGEAIFRLGRDAVAAAPPAR
jgi:C4-dicarboxylate-specific signal transduction histidine kinase